MKAVCLLLTAALAIAGCDASKSSIYGRGLDHYQAQRYAEAFPLVREAAEAGNVNAMGLLGVMYLYGRGVPADGAQAERWLLAASEKGLVIAQSIVGIMYASGVGVAKNPEKARYWLALAANGGDEDARRLLQNMKEAPDPPR